MNFRSAFWSVDLAAIVLFAFFLALGAFSLADSVWVTALIGVLGAAYVIHVVLVRRSDDGHRNAATAHDRERRGF